MKIKIVKNESNDWSVVLVDGRTYYSGHSIPNDVWMSLINDLTEIIIEEVEITDDDMENGTFS